MFQTKKSYPHLNLNSFSITQDEYTIQCGFNQQEKIQAYKLRAETYCNELQWVAKPESGQETDRVDGNAIDIGIFKDNELIAYLRCLPPTSLWMINKEFINISLNKKTTLQSRNSCEATRLLVKKSYRKHKFMDGNTPADALYQGLFAFCQQNNYRFVHMTVSDHVLKALIKKGLPCVTTSKKQRMDDGVIAVNGVLDWEAFLAIDKPCAQLRKKQYLEIKSRAFATKDIRIPA